MTSSESVSGSGAQIQSHNEGIKCKEAPPESTLTHAFQVGKQYHYEELLPIVHGGFPGTR